MDRDLRGMDVMVDCGVSSCIRLHGLRSRTFLRNEIGPIKLQLVDGDGIASFTSRLAFNSFPAMVGRKSIGINRNHAAAVYNNWPPGFLVVSFVNDSKLHCWSGREWILRGRCRVVEYRIGAIMLCRRLQGPMLPFK